ncbi:class I SAM-dependent methyltransferase [Massilia sp. W12]|uniref:class I SAM-dependent methyltransferase n=1 Tax=Massilia sp. W12 TaxID=3126507 RepID=UPI0030D357E7
MIIDVPSPIDLRKLDDAREWESKAMVVRPWRTEFFAEFHKQLARISAQRILELGSGPGFLCAALLEANPAYEYSALDFSAAMHTLARNRLGARAEQVRFIERSFKEPDWAQGLGEFDAVITNQAVHELRHKAYATGLHRQVRAVLKPGAAYLVCDHYVGEDGMKNDQLYMTIEEQRNALLEAGFTSVAAVLVKGGLALHCAS